MSDLKITDWSIIIQTLVLIVTAYYVNKYTKETKKSNELNSRISEADFILRLSQDVFTERFSDIFKAIESNSISFFEKNYRFYIKDTYINVITGEGKGDITSYEMDDVILGNFENIGILYKRGIIPIDLIYEFFDYYIEITWKNKEIQKYIEVINKEPGSYQVYSNFKELFNKCEEYGKRYAKQNP